MKLAVIIRRHPNRRLSAAVVQDGHQGADMLRGRTYTDVERAKGKVYETLPGVEIEFRLEGGVCGCA